MTVQTIKDVLINVVLPITLGGLMGFGVIGILNNIPETVPTVTCEIK